MINLKTKNLALEQHTKSMEALLHSNHIGVPLVGKNEDPEATPQEANAPENPIDMLDQIAELDAVDNDVARILEMSARPAPTQNKLLASTQ